MVYPEIDNRIDSLENELKDVLEKINKYKNSNIDTTSILRTLQTTYDSCKEELEETIAAKVAIQRGLHKLTPMQKDIIQHRFWQKGRMTWENIADNLKFHRVYLQRQYKNALEIIIT